MDSVDLDVRSGEVVGLAGASGCGKSALVDVLAGRLTPDAGRVIIAGNPLLLAGIADVVRVIRQPDDVAMDLSVAQNVCLGAEPRNRLGLVSCRALARRATEILGKLGFGIDPGMTVRDLPPAYRCVVQAANAYANGARVVALDGLSTLVPADEMRHVHTLAAGLAAAGLAVIHTSRCPGELKPNCDRVMVLRNGRLAPDSQEWTATERERQADEPVLDVRGLRCRGAEQDVSFTVAGGEIVALIGPGSGEAGKALFGVAPILGGEILLHGEPLRLRGPKDAVRAGVGYLADGLSGLIPGQTVGGNLRLLAPSQTWSRRAEQRLVRNAQTLLGVECPDPRTPVDGLGAADMRKVGLAKWLAAESEVLVLHEPNSAADDEIRWMIRELAAAGVAIVLITSDPADVSDLADRVVALGESIVGSSL